jgi:hypothetical protein
MILVHALAGIQSCTSTTMQVHGSHRRHIVARVADSGSTHNFIDTSATAHAGIVFQGDTSLQVVVANRDRVTGPGHCTDLIIDITDKPFVLTCYGLALGPFDMVLDVQWLESMGPVL